ncbi:hypothetical protein DOTSEDRAFT_133285 [Dothistroma septosporum NZE10]|uniref:Uncharacterized protein n=1 Tax=Dothistroma septosporum (strain NZE10 / CBS 128990) TaxID=675120 RepID=N1PJQ3_DOTSN|nr:hypothetical protein DOTSEDRAFT_133285 [Dothistroma septosporum NZE10]
MSILYARENDAVRDNPPYANGRAADIHITERGSDFYYAICATMGFCGIVFLGCSLTKRRTDRIFFYLTAAINFTACVAYYSMGSNLGFTPIAVEFNPIDSHVHGMNRQVFWVRYVDWFITTPLLLLDLFLTAGLPAPTIFWAIFMNELMIIMGLVGAVTKSGYKWGFFAFGCAAMFMVFYTLLFAGRKYARHLGSDVSLAYLLPTVLLVLIWLCYPICWGVSEGGNIIAPDSEAVYYGVLDFVAKPVFSALLLFFHRKIDPARMGLKFREYDEDFAIMAIQNGHNRHHHDRKDEAPALGEGVRASEAADRPVAGDGTTSTHHDTVHNDATHPA